MRTMTVKGFGQLGVRCWPVVPNMPFMLQIVILTLEAPLKEFAYGR